MQFPWVRSSKLVEISCSTWRPFLLPTVGQAGGVEEIKMICRGIWRVVREVDRFSYQMLRIHCEIRLSNTSASSAVFLDRLYR